MLWCQLPPTDLTPHAYRPQSPTDTDQSGTASLSTHLDAEPLADLAVEVGISADQRLQVAEPLTVLSQ